MYAAPVLSLSNRQMDEHGACWNSVIRHIFGYSRSESVKEVLLGLGRLNVKHLVMLRKAQFYKHLWLSSNMILSNVLSFVLLFHCEKNCMLKLFSDVSDTEEFVFGQFYAYVNR